MSYTDDFGLDDEMGEDDFGAEISQRKLARLLQRRAKLMSLLPISGAARQALINARLKRIDRVLAASGYTAEQAAAEAAVAASGIEGIGGLQFQAQAPPGVGRLVRLPFYPSTANAGVITASGINTANLVSPMMIEQGANPAQACGTEHILTTPQISWATLRIVGFEAAQRAFKGIGNPGPLVMVADLQIGGGANLFTHEDFADAWIYDAAQPEFCGLRDYPILKSPNTAQVAALLVGDQDGETVTWSASLLAEVLVDDNYGAHIPGAYARKGALVRQGGSFV